MENNHLVINGGDVAQYTRTYSRRAVLFTMNKSYFLSGLFRTITSLSSKEKSSHVCCFQLLEGPAINPQCLPL